ncbi:S-layer homology domain-containing protein [Natranaerovirga pectinivora]|nr:S-layer homology domain-containing protein [Natranaerovirga pectinivora]
MRKSFLKRVSVSLVIIILTTINIYANQSNLSDIKGHWAEPTIQKLVARGGISGYPDGTFKPQNTISNAEFIAILMRTTTGKTFTRQQGQHWASGEFEEAYKLGIVTNSELSSRDFDKPITRLEMAKYTERALLNILGEEQVNSDGIEVLIGDYNKITKRSEQYYIKSVYARGIIVGDDKGNFNPGNNATRAEASTIILRTLEKPERQEVKIPEVGALTLRHNDPNRPMAKEGDTFITPDGRSVVLKVDPKTGILGFGQNVATEIGRAHPNGKLIEHGDLGSNKEFLGSPYLVDNNTGMGLYRSQWLDVQSAIDPYKEVPNPKEGQVYMDYFIFMHGIWYWNGPVR